MRLFWRWHVLKHLAKRRAKRRANSNPPATEHIPSDME
jgi:hypothetical protein